MTQTTDAVLETAIDYMHRLITEQGYKEFEAAWEAARYCEASANEIFDYWMNS